eukprot:1157805-Pelagomonas_calceolata.AAC.11
MPQEKQWFSYCKLATAAKLLRSTNTACSAAKLNRKRIGRAGNSSGKHRQHIQDVHLIDAAHSTSLAQLKLMGTSVTTVTPVYTHLVVGLLTVHGRREHDAHMQAAAWVDGPLAGLTPAGIRRASMQTFGHNIRAVGARHSNSKNVLQVVLHGRESCAQDHIVFARNECRWTKPNMVLTAVLAD